MYSCIDDIKTMDNNFSGNFELVWFMCGREKKLKTNQNSLFIIGVRHKM